MTSSLRINDNSQPKGYQSVVVDTERCDDGETNIENSDRTVNDCDDVDTLMHDSFFKDKVTKIGLLFFGVAFFAVVAFHASNLPFSNNAMAAINHAINPVGEGVDARGGPSNQDWGNKTRDDGWPSYHFEVFHFCPHMIDFMYTNQIHPQSKVDEVHSGGIIYEPQHPGGLAEDGFAEILQQTLPRFYDYPVGLRLNDRPAEVSAYWTLMIRIARGNTDSMWYDYAKSLPTGIQRIRVKKPLQWDGESVTEWSSITSYNVLVY